MKFFRIFKHRKNRTLLRYGFFISLVILIIGSISSNINVEEDEYYYEKDLIELYILEYGEVPDNYVLKYESSIVEGNDLYWYETFFNREQLLPLDQEYTEVYINATSFDKGAERLVFSEETLYYTSDHYHSFDEVSKFNILGTHYIYNTLIIVEIIIMTSGVSLMIFKLKIFTVEDLRNDIKSNLRFISSKGIKAKE